VNKDEHVNNKRCGEFEKPAGKPTFPVRFCSFTCPQTRHVGSMVDERRNTRDRELTSLDTKGMQFSPGKNL